MHIEKYKNVQVSAILGHDKREHLHYKNENVDLSLSPNNTIFTNRSLKYYEDRIKNDLYVYGGWNDKNKLKYNSLCSIVVHCPKDYKDKERFFKIMNFVLTKKYGKENVIFSGVHKDELFNGKISEHLHFAFIPCIYNEKKKKYQLSYEKCMAHKFNSFHEDIEQLIKEYFPKEKQAIKLHDEENKDKFYFDHIEEYKEYKKHLDIVKSNISKLSKMLVEKKEELARVDFQLDEAIQLLTETNQKLNNIFGAKSLDEQIKNASISRD